MTTVWVLQIHEHQNRRHNNNHNRPDFKQNSNIVHGLSQPSSMFSFAQECPFRSVTERSAKELNLEPPKYLEALLTFPLTVATLELVFAPESADSLELRRGPESGNSLPEICKQKRQALTVRQMVEKISFRVRIRLLKGKVKTNKFKTMKTSTDM